MKGLVNGVEVVDEAAACFVLKAMEAKWAENLVQHGRLRLGSLAYYRALECDELGDKWEGIGKRDVNGMSVEVTDANDVFLFCAAAQYNHERLLSLAAEYDTIVRITNPIGFAHAIVKAARDIGVDFFAQIGVCRYHRGFGVQEPEQTTWASSWNIFEKEQKYSHQCEYRFAFFRCTLANDLTLDSRSGPVVRTEEFLYLTIEKPMLYLSIA